MKRLNLYILTILIIGLQQVYSQCYPDQHSTTWFDGWISCDTTANPNTVYGESHWILFDLGYDYILNETKLWNANEPNNLDFGIQNYYIDYSLDGMSWISLGEFTMNQASGTSIYEGEEGPDFNGTKARFVLITPTTNYGGGCFGFSEFKVTITDPFEDVSEEDGFNALVYPNPFVDNIQIRIASLDDQPMNYTLHDILGRQIIQNTIEINSDSDTYEIELNGHLLSTGIYILNIEQGDNQRSFKLIKKD